MNAREDLEAIENPAFISKLDPKAVFDQNSIAITLIRERKNQFGIKGRHAMLIIESLDAERGHVVQLAHLLAPSDLNNSVNCTSLMDLLGTRFFHAQSSRVEVLDISNKEIRYSEKSHTWVVEKAKADLMLDAIDKEASGESPIPPFYLLGGESILSIFSNRVRDGAPARNCMGWALDKLKLAGINLSRQENCLITYTPFYTRKDNRYHLKAYGTKELCEFIRLNNADAIRRLFPVGSIDINACITNNFSGSAEFVLREYNPLIIACAYGKWEIAAMLINDYNADVTVRVGYGLTLTTFNALECAKKQYFGLTKILKNDHGKQALIELIEEKLAEVENLKLSRSASINA
jgi:hypothetical protein